MANVCYYAFVPIKSEEEPDVNFKKAFIPLLLCALSVSVYASPYSSIKLKVDGVERQAIASVPDDAQARKNPLILAFHGHGGTMYAAAATFDCEAYWPEAIVVYPQGLRTPGGIVDAEGRFPGWQMNIGEMGDRDIHFFDALLEYLKSRYPIDEARIYALGHSNGGLFAYELWAARPKEIAKLASIAAIIPTKVDRKALQPKPVFHVAGKNDPLVLYSWQLETMEFVRSLNRCEGSWDDEAGKITLYASPLGAPLATYIHDGGHEVPEGVLSDIVAFFKED